jgi:hypothetical protein
LRREQEDGDCQWPIAERFWRLWGLAFASAEDGTITVIKEVGGDKFSVVQTVTTQKSARTMAVDGRTHQLFTVAANVGPRPERRVEPGSFVVLMVEGTR